MALFGKSSRQPVLDENASLYQALDTKTEKQKWSEMDARQRWQYFLDYYLLKCLICLIVAGISASLLWSFFSPKKETALSAAIIHHPLTESEKGNITKRIAERLSIDPEHQEISVDDAFPEGYEGEMKLQAYISGQNIDLIITDEEQFSRLASFGYFSDLSELLPDAEKIYFDGLYYTSGYVESTTDDTDNTAKKQAASSGQDNDVKHADTVKAYGLIVTDSSLIKDSWPKDAMAVAGVVVNSGQKENAVAAILELLN